MKSLMNLDGKKGLILGVANDQSIAWGCALLAKKMGADVVVTCLNEKAKKYVEPLTQAEKIVLEVCDVEQSGAIDLLIGNAINALGHLDFVIHSIAWAPLQDLHGKVIDSSSMGFSRAMEVSCHSFATLAKLCSPHMSAGGTMIAMSYLGADEAVPHYGLMGPVKAALESLVRYMAVELGGHGIRIHAVSPGPILTRAASGINHFDELLSHAVQKSPLGRPVRLDEIANLCMFLCSDGASGMTGQTIYVDGGCHAVA